MAWKDKASASYSGASGQMAVIAELFQRKCNAAIPYIDVGTDVFAFRDDREEVARLQVKTAPAKWYKKRDGYSAKFNVPIKQLDQGDEPSLFFVFVVRDGSQWRHFVILSRVTLAMLRDRGCGSENRASGDLELVLQFRLAADNLFWQVLCGSHDMTGYLDAWKTLPPLAVD